MKALWLGFIALSFLVIPAGAAKAQPAPFDHLKCYKIKDARGFAEKVYKVDLVPEQKPPFDDERCVVKMKAKLFCIDVDKANVDPPLPGVAQPAPQATDYLCYKFKGKCTPPVPKDFKIEVTDQFASGTIVIKRAGFLCSPATKGVVTTTTTLPTTTTSTTTTTTTTTTIPTECCEFEHPEIPGQPVCFDTDKCPDKCPLLGGVCVPGFCDPVDELCRAAPPTTEAPFCCECPVSVPPFPNPTFCFDTFQTVKCQAMGPGCALVAGAHCDPVTERCQ